MGSGLSNLHFGATTYLDPVTVSSAIRGFDDKVEKDQHLAETFQDAKSKLEIGKTPIFHGLY